MPNGQPAQLANLKQWRKGESGNSRGRTVTYPEQLSFSRRHSLEALQHAVELWRDPEVPPATRLAACQFVHQAAWGRPKQTVEVGGETAIPALKIEFVAPPERTQTIDSERPVLDALPFDPSQGDE